MKDKKEETYDETKARLKEELSDLFYRYGFDMVKLIVDEEDYHRCVESISKPKIKR